MRPRNCAEHGWRCLASGRGGKRSPSGVRSPLTGGLPAHSPPVTFGCAIEIVSWAFRRFVDFY